MIEKQSEKLTVLDELHNGQIKSTIKELKLADISRIIDSEINSRSLLVLNKR